MSTSRNLQWLSEIEEQEKEKTVKLLTKILKKIIANPTVDKYCKLKIATIQQRLSYSKLCIDILLSAGFHKSTNNQKLFFDKTKLDDLKKIYQALLSQNKQYFVDLKSYKNIDIHSKCLVHGYLKRIMQLFDNHTYNMPNIIVFICSLYYYADLVFAICNKKHAKITANGSKVVSRALCDIPAQFVCVASHYQMKYGIHGFSIICRHTASQTDASHLAIGITTDLKGASKHNQKLCDLGKSFFYTCCGEIRKNNKHTFGSRFATRLNWTDGDVIKTIFNCNQGIVWFYKNSGLIGRFALQSEYRNLTYYPVLQMTTCYSDYDCNEYELLKWKLPDDINGNELKQWLHQENIWDEFLFNELNKNNMHKIDMQL
eukprot:113761_1